MPILMIAVSVAFAGWWFSGSQSAASEYEALIIVFALIMPIGVLISSFLRLSQVDFLNPYFYLPFSIGVFFGGGIGTLASEGRDADSEMLGRLILSGLTAYFLGVMLSRTVMASRTGTGISRIMAPVSMPRIGLAPILAAYALGAVATFMYWTRAGGIPALMPDVETARIAALTGAGIPFYLSMLMMPATWMLFAFDANMRTVVKLGLLTVATLLLASTGWRNTPVALLVVTLMIAHYRRPFRLRTLAVSALSVSSGAAALGIYRVMSSGLESYQTYQLVRQGDILGALVTYLTTYAATFARNLVDVVNLVPTSLPYQHGQSFIWNFFSLIPGEHRDPFDFVLKHAAGQGFVGGGLPPTLVGEWFINFGWIGIFVGMFAVGILAATCHAVLRARRASVARIIVIIVLYYLFSAVRGGVGDVLLTVVWLTAVSSVLYRVAVDPMAGRMTTVEDS